MATPNEEDPPPVPAAAPAPTLTSVATTWASSLFGGGGSGSGSTPATPAVATAPAAALNPATSSGGSTTSGLTAGGLTATAAATATATAAGLTEMADTLTRLGFGGALARTGSDAVDTPQFATERRNLLNVFTIALKALLEACADHSGEAVNDDVPQLDRFCVVMENVFRHGLRAKRTMLGRKRDYWDLIENLERLVPSAHNILLNVRSIPDIKTSAGRGRAFIRTALMEKTLATYWNALLSDRALVREWYEVYALVRSEELDHISGMLVGLSAFDFNLYIRGEDLERRSDVIDWSMYLRDGNLSAPSRGASGAALLESPIAGAPSTDAGTLEGSTEASTPAESLVDQLSRRLKTSLDQKSYIEEVLRSTEKKLADHQERLEAAGAAQRQAEEQLRQRTEQMAGIDKALQQTGRELANLRMTYSTDVDRLRHELDTERQTGRTIKSESAQLVEGMKAALAAETKLRQSLETELANERDRRQRELGASTSSQTALDEELRQVRTQLEESQARTRQLESDLEEVTRERESLGAQLTDVRQTIRQLREELQSAKEKAAAGAKSKKDAKTVKADLDAAQARTAELSAALAEATAAIKLAQAERDEKENALGSAIAELAETQEELAKERAEFPEILAAKDELLADRDEQIENLQEQIDQLNAVVADRDRALKDIAQLYGQTQQKMVDLNEFREQIRTSEWVDDRTITHCTKCREKFTVNRRKHHCRSCGQVFCNDCSNQKMKIPSSAKPVRVCDDCHIRLLQSLSG